MSKNGINFEITERLHLPSSDLQKKRLYLIEIIRKKREFEFETTFLSLNTYKINSQCVIPMVCEIALNKKIFDAVENVVGKNILIWSVEFFIRGKKQVCSLNASDLTGD